MNKYEFTIVARCPNNEDFDHYTVSIETEKMIMCEELAVLSNSYKQTKIFQEDLTEYLASLYNCKVTLSGYHCGHIKVTTTRG